MTTDAQDVWPSAQLSPFLQASLNADAALEIEDEVTSMLARLTQFTVRSLDRLAARVLIIDDRPEHQRTDRRGEEEAYFWLRKQGYVVVARNYRRHGGEANSTWWDGMATCCVSSR